MQDLSIEFVDWLLAYREGFSIRILFEDGVVTGADVIGILDSPPQFKANTPFTSFAERKAVPGQQRRLMHQAMFIVSYAVNTAVRDEFSGPIPLVHALSSIAIGFALKRNMRY
jgi:hypothetical protein